MYHKILFFFAVVCLTPSLWAGAGSTSTSCAGQVKLCANCSPEYFYIYAFQHAHVKNGKIQSESHSLTTSGFLGNPSEWEVVRGNSTHIFYSNGELNLAIPYKNSEDGILLLDEESLSILKLCPIPSTDSL